MIPAVVQREALVASHTCAFVKIAALTFVISTWLSKITLQRRFSKLKMKRRIQHLDMIEKKPS